MRPIVSIRKALTDPGLLGGVLAGDTWRAWRVLLIAAMGETLTDAERALFAEVTGREREPGQRVEELIGVIGRRGGKSRAISTLAAYVGGLCDHRDVLAPGETGVLLVIAPDQRQAAITLDYATAAFEATPIMRQLIAGKNADTLTLTTGISIEVRAASFRRLRGPTYIAIIADEACYFFTEESSANADSAILNAVRPGLATTRGPLIVISSPHARRGEVWEAHKRHYGPAGDPLILVAQGASRTFNPSLPQSVVDRALERDHAAASAEYLAQFRSDIENYVSREQVERCVDPGVRERPPVPGTRYISFTDPSGGSGDSMVCAIGHVEDDGALVLDALREITAPFDPESAVDELAQFLGQFKVSETTGDRYSAQWCAQAFEKRGVRYNHSELNKSQLYVELLPRLNAKTIRLLDHPRAINQICMLERRTARGGRDTIDHSPNGHDDVANGIAGLCGLAARRSTYDSSLSWVFGDEDARDAWNTARLRQHLLS